MHSSRVLAAAGIAIAAITSPALGTPLLRIGVIGTLAGTHPDLQTGGSAYQIGGLAIRGLTYFDGQVAMACLLCETLPTRANGGVIDHPTPEGGAGEKVRFRLKKGLAWDDGTPVTAQDVALAWRAGSRPDSAYAWRTRMQGEIWNVAARGPRGVEVYRRGRSCTPADFRFAALPSRLEAPLIGDGYAAMSHFVTAPATPGLYNGPYRVTDYSAEADRQTVTLERNRHWTGPRPVYDRIQLVYRRTAAAMVDALVAGEVDMLADTTPAIANAVTARVPGRFADVRREGRVLMQVTINQDDPRLADARVRRALARALDRPALAAAFGPRTLAARSFLTPRFPYFDAGIPDAPGRIDEAAQLLDQAGWRMGAGGLRENGTGATLSFRLAVAPSQIEQPFVTAIKRAWAKIGVEVAIERFGGIAQLTAKDPPPLALFAYQLEGGRNADFHVFDSRSVPKLDEVRNGLNIFRWRDAAADRAVAALRDGCDEGTLAGAYGTLQRRVAEEVPLIPLFFTPEAHLLPRHLALPDEGRIALLLPQEVERWRLR